MGTDIEYGIRWTSEPLGEGERPHRVGMSFAQAKEFVDTWEDDGGKPNVFTIICRPVGAWADALGAA